MTSMLDAYRSALTAMGISAAQACPSAGQDLQRTLTGLGKELSETADPDLVTSTDAHVVQGLQQWGNRAQASLEQKTHDVKELLVVLSQTASTMASTDTRYSKRFDDFTARLERIANLEDLTQLRMSLVRSAAELKTCVEQMSQSARDSVAQLQAKVASSQSKLEEAEALASRDALTGLFNRSRLTANVDQRIAAGLVFSVAMIDLNGFKQVNDRFGHASGDDLLKQFSADLRANARQSDLVGRWGGDEFLVVLACPRAEAQTHIERIEKWVVGDYTIASASGPQRVQLGAAIGLAQWTPGQSMTDVVNRADADMYANKRAAR